MTDKGIFAVYKPKGPTSHDIIEEIRRISGERRVGHAGTLDPLAEGVLVVAIGRENTKKLGSVAGTEKEYLCGIRLGETSLTGDKEGPISPGRPERPSKEEIDKVIKYFKGKTMQRPHKFSAVKIKGKKAYKLARKGLDPETEPKEIVIEEMELLKYEYPDLSLRVVCGPGTYMRSLAEDVGEKLGTGAYLRSLKRTRVGDFTEEEALSLDKLKEKIR